VIPGDDHRRRQKFQNHVGDEKEPEAQEDVNQEVDPQKLGDDGEPAWGRFRVRGRTEAAVRRFARGHLEKDLDPVQELPYLAEEGLHVEERGEDDDGYHLHKVPRRCQANRGTASSLRGLGSRCPQARGTCCWILWCSAATARSALNRLCWEGTAAFVQMIRSRCAAKPSLPSRFERIFFAEYFAELVHNRALNRKSRGRLGNPNSIHLDIPNQFSSTSPRQDLS
jgi:hypothetical protein